MKMEAYVDHSNNYPYAIDFRTAYKRPQFNWADIRVWCNDTYGSPHGRGIHDARWFGRSSIILLRFRALADAEWFLLRWA